MQSPARSNSCFQRYYKLTITININENCNEMYCSFYIREKPSINHSMLLIIEYMRCKIASSSMGSQHGV